MKYKKGFTLIELLVVIAIIGLLSSVVLASLNSARIKANDTRRIADLRQIRIALELYYDNVGHYPIIGGWATSEPTLYDSGTSWANLQASLSLYLKQLPNDPKPTGTNGPWTTGNYHYAYMSSDGQIYDLVAQLEDTNNNNRCAIKQWRYHKGEGIYPPDTIWCGLWSLYMYADH